jgi:sRNA-binding regulator protein Hfq
MNITIYLNNSMQFNATVEGYNAADFSAQLNNPQITMVSIGNIVLNKHAVMMIVPTDVLPTEGA